MRKEMNFGKVANLDAWSMSYGPQVKMAMKAWNLAPPTFLGRTERLRQRLLGLKLRSFGLRNRALEKARDQYERHLITQYIRHGGEYFYKTFKAPKGARTSEKCKPYRHADHRD